MQGPTRWRAAGSSKRLLGGGFAKCTVVEGTTGDPGLGRGARRHGMAAAGPPVHGAVLCAGSFIGHGAPEGALRLRAVTLNTARMANCPTARQL